MFMNVEAAVFRDLGLAPLDLGVEEFLIHRPRSGRIGKSRGDVRAAADRLSYPSADQSTKVRAMFVTPRQVNEILKARLVVEGEAGNDRMTLKCEAKSRPAGLAEAIAASIRDLTKMRGEEELVEAGTLPNDGKVIEDLRKYV